MFGKLAVLCGVASFLAPATFGPPTIALWVLSAIFDDADHNEFEDDEESVEDS